MSLFVVELMQVVMIMALTMMMTTVATTTTTKFNIDETATTKQTNSFQYPKQFPSTESNYISFRYS